MEAIRYQEIRKKEEKRAQRIPGTQYPKADHYEFKAKSKAHSDYDPDARNDWNFLYDGGDGFELYE